MTNKRRLQFGSDVAQARVKQRTAISRDDEGEEESNMGMDVPIREHPRTEVQLGLPCNPSTTSSQVESHKELAVPGIYASEMVVDRWTPTEHSASDRHIIQVCPFISKAPETYHDGVSPIILKGIAEKNNKQISWENAHGLIQGNKWLWDFLIACWEKGSFRDIRCLSERLLHASAFL